MTKLLACVRVAPCIAMVLIAAPARAQLEGTLFTEAEERVYLDYLREEFLHRLAWWQWSAAECRSGEFWGWMTEVLRAIH